MNRKNPLTGSLGPMPENDPLAQQKGTSSQEHLISLLCKAAEIEHALMVQYLYSAYSLDDSGPPKIQRKVRGWRDSILTVAKEEMGHLLTVQNLLCLLGGSLCLSRPDFPWDSAFNPYPFRLEPFSIDSLSAYIHAETPKDLKQLEGARKNSRAWKYLDRNAKRILEAVLARSTGKVGDPVGRLYNRIIEIVGNKECIPDSAFRAKTYSIQASWDDWGRGYRPAPSTPGTTTRRKGASRSHVIIAQMGTRTQALAALREVAGQGEAPHLRANLGEDEPSHFGRFVKIYQDIEKANGWSLARNIAINPIATGSKKRKASEVTQITAEPSRTWARLFNVRYRMLLTYLVHTFRLSRAEEPSQAHLRGAVMHKCFGEMYHLKAIAGILVRLPLVDGQSAKDTRRAGPPFEMPPDLLLPKGEKACWEFHREILCESENLCAELISRAQAVPEEMKLQVGGYLLSLREIDQDSAAWIGQMIGRPQTHSLEDV